MIKLRNELGKQYYSAENYITHSPANNEVQVVTDNTTKTFKSSKKRKSRSPKRPHGYGDISSAYNAKRTKEADARKEQLKEAIKAGDVKTVEQGAELLSVSVSTVHRYLNDLEMKLKSH